MESETHPPEEPHPDEPAGNGESPSEQDYDADEQDDPLPPAEATPSDPENLVDRAQDLIHGGMSKLDR